MSALEVYVLTAGLLHGYLLLAGMLYLLAYLLQPLAHLLQLALQAYHATDEDGADR